MCIIYQGTILLPIVLEHPLKLEIEAKDLMVVFHTEY